MEMELPKINLRRTESRTMQLEIESGLFELIDKIEKENNYQFEPYEIDNALLGMIKRNHERYLNNKFGNNVEF